jgi:hypothetical protein
MTVYTLGDVIQRAQETLDVHVPAAHTGRCLACGAQECPYREEAVRIFSRYHHLPARRPGATLPELLCARRITPRVFGD